MRSATLSNLAFATQLAQSLTRASPRSTRYLLMSKGLEGLASPLAMRRMLSFGESGALPVARATA